MMPLYFMSATLYPIELVPAKLQSWILINPIVHFIEYFRHCFYGSVFQTHGNLLVILIAPVISVFIGLSFYTLKKKELLEP